MDELLAAEELAAPQRDADYRRLVAEQAALRRLAVLVTRGVEPSEVFDAVVKEMRRCLDTERAGLWRYETSREITLLASDFRSAVPAKWPVGTRTPIDGNTLAAMVKHTGGPARMDSYEESTGQLAAHIHAMGLRAAVGVPVIVEFTHTGLVPRFPTALLAAAIVILSFLSFACGLILDTVSRGRAETRRLAYLSFPVRFSSIKPREFVQPRR